MSFDPVAALQRYHEAIDAHDMDAVAEMFAPDSNYVSEGLGAVEGRGNILAAMRAYFTGHPDHQSWDDEVKQTGAFSARSIWKLKATNKTTGAVVRRQGTEDITFDGTGKILRVEVQDLT
jgi:uncharacterized protein (TIGR02246 family)